MRIELIIFVIAVFLMANIYSEGKYFKVLLSWKKYYQMAGVAIGALMLYWLIKKNPFQARQMIAASNDYIKYLPVDRHTSSFISPILDFTSKQNIAQEQGQQGGSMFPILPMGQEQQSQTKILSSGKTGTKRSVSETKKKFVASSQNWKCGDCGIKLPAWFEVDHRVRLEYGGSNHIDNLVALCRDCHGKKTAMENL
jgi:5-methylcytosine-specific restriction endonuclease McrA